MYYQYYSHPYHSQAKFYPYQSRAYSHYPNNNPYHLNTTYTTYATYDVRQQNVQGQATWTEGGPITQCGIPWSHNDYMTVAVGFNTPYQCGQSLKITYPATQREIIVTVVDKVPDFPQNKVNLHRRAFEALGADVEAGIINVDITPAPEFEEGRWERYLLRIIQTAYPMYRVIDSQFVESVQLSPTEAKEIYEYTLQSPQETIMLEGTVTYNPQTNRMLSFDITERQ